MPQIQLGLYMMSGREATNSVRWALAAGYRGFDCAQMYHNEREAGKAILNFLAGPGNTEGLPREDIHYTTKLASCSTNYDAVRRSIKKSVDVSGLGYVDLMLLHSPYGGKEARLTSWKALEDAVEAGEVKMAGVSNYGVRHVSVFREQPSLSTTNKQTNKHRFIHARPKYLADRLNLMGTQIEELMASNPKVHPVVNQIEVHPFNTQTAIRETCAKHNIVVEAYAPLARAMRMRHPKIVEFAKKYSCTPAQLFVR